MNERTVTSEADGASGSREPLAGWAAFERDLALTLSFLKNEFLVISSKTGNRFVQFNARPDEGVLAETVSNAYLEAGEKLDEAQLAALAGLGWLAPTRAPDEAPAKGSPNFFREFPTPVSFSEIARLATRTLSEVHGLPGPEALEYHAFDDPGRPVTLPGLHLDRAPRPAPKAKPVSKRRKSGPFARLRAEVLAAAREASGFGALEYDADGDLAVPVGRRMGWVRPYQKPFYVRVFCHLLEVEADEELLERIHEVNSRLPLARVIYKAGNLYLGVDFPAAPFHAAHLSQAVTALASLADDVLNDLRPRVGKIQEGSEPKVN